MTSLSAIVVVALALVGLGILIWTAVRQAGPSATPVEQVTKPALGS